jgi:hypothetical protein
MNISFHCCNRSLRCGSCETPTLYRPEQLDSMKPLLAGAPRVDLVMDHGKGSRIVLDCYGSY